ncbi:MAG: hypothetical protein U5P10_16020 [Spirochaetia bacterium]|nr:hypothetical protein [Spirochaetia bacterium]
MPNIKVILWSAGSAAVIALLAGLFGRVTFFDLLLRVLLGGAAFGLFGAGVSLLLMRFVPELFEQQESEEDGFTAATSEAGEKEAPAQQGNNLNIVLDGDEYSYGDTAEATAENEVESGDFVEDEEQFVEEVSESEDQSALGRQTETGTAHRAQVSSDPESSSAEKPAAASADYQEFENLADVDTLPDLDEFSDSFESVAAAQDSENESNGGGGYSSTDSVDIMGDEQDPATVAKAVRTIIGRDQEG